MDLKDLTKEIPFKWKMNSYSSWVDKQTGKPVYGQKDYKKHKPTKASCVAYIDARDVMDLLDDVVGPENWQDDYKVVKDKLIAGIGIKCGDSWVWKYDTGTEAKTETEKSENSDAFKRAGVKWGVGRFLYKQNIITVPIDDYKNPLGKDGNKVDLNEYCNKLNDYFNSKK